MGRKEGSGGWPVETTNRNSSVSGFKSGSFRDLLAAQRFRRIRFRFPPRFLRRHLFFSLCFGAHPSPKRTWQQNSVPIAEPHSSRQRSKEENSVLWFLPRSSVKTHFLMCFPIFYWKFSETADKGRKDEYGE